MYKACGWSLPHPWKICDSRGGVFFGASLKWDPELEYVPTSNGCGREKSLIQI